MKLKELLINNVYSQALDDLRQDKKLIVNTINPHSYCVAKNDPIFSEALVDADCLVPDGTGIVMAYRFLLKKKIKKIAGADVHDHFLEKAGKQGGRVFYLGSTSHTLNILEEKIKNKYPNIVVSSFSPPFKSSFSEEDIGVMINKVNSFKPDYLFVGMTAPKQEKFVYQNKERINADVICSIGAVFDFYAGVCPRPNQFWINMRLEWLIRFLREPKRLWKRNFISTPIFLLDMLKEKYSDK